MQCYKQIFVKHNDIYTLVPCGKCNFCLQNRRNDWAFRLLQEQKVSKTSNFLTLTYNNQHLPYTYDEEVDRDFITGATLVKNDLFTFHKSIKQKQKRLLGKNYDEYKIRYYSVGEYGSMGRPHYHSIMFNILPEILNEAADTWGKGIVHNGNVTPASVAYVAKYVIDRDDFNKEKYNPETMLWEKVETQQIKPFNCMSRNPGIGANYLINQDWHRAIDDYNPDNFRIYAIQDGKKVRLPRYYKDKIFKEIDTWYTDIMATSLETYYNDLAEEFEKTYLKEIEHIESAYMCNSRVEAIEKYNEFRNYHHDQIRIKSLKLNKL